MRVMSVSSGTSADGIDVGVVDFAAPEAASGLLTASVVHTATEAWPPSLRERLLALLPPATSSAAEWCALDTAVGKALGAAATAAVARLAEGGRGVDLVVSPGQTVHHEVQGAECLGTLQIGQPAWIAEATGAPVLSDLRARDVAAGGHGAPLAGVLDRLWLGGLPGQSARVALNLGGIANVSVVTGDGVTAWDTGPANALLDVATTWATDGAQTFDRGGLLAAPGTIDVGLLEGLRAHPYFALGPPKTTGRETFSAAWLWEVVAADGGVEAVRAHDLLATLVALTASTVADAVLPAAPVEVVVSGGGAANPVLMAALRARLPGVDVVDSERYGLPADGKEAVLWALLGWLSWHGIPVSTAPGPDGASSGRVLGRLTPGGAPLRLPEPLPPPTALQLRRPG